MNGIRRNIAVLILALPMMFLILHDIIPHHHHGHHIAAIECSHDHHEDHQDIHDGCCSDEGDSCDMNTCQACQFETEFTLDNSFSRLSAVIPFILINIEEPSESCSEVKPEYIPETFQGYSLTKFLRGPPSC